MRVLRRSGKPVVLAANKVDDAETEADAAALWNLGLGEPYAVSALHGRGSGDLLDAVLAALPEAPSDADRADRPGPAGSRCSASPTSASPACSTSSPGRSAPSSTPWPGTTVDPVDELVELGGRTWRFVDTAGIRRRANEASGHEYYATLRTQAALEKAEVAVVLLDASEPLTEQDTRILSLVVEAGRALVLAFNKWDLVDEDRRYCLEREIERELVRVPWAHAGQHLRQDRPARGPARAGARGGARRLGDAGPDGPAQRVPRRARRRDPTAGPQRQAAAILFATQADIRPPQFVLFASGFLEASYRRFIERRLREEFGFAGTPIELSVRVREKRGKK